LLVEGQRAALDLIMPAFFGFAGGIYLYAFRFLVALTFITVSVGYAGFPRREWNCRRCPFSLKAPVFAKCAGFR
jgi:hypothetical protein